MGKAVLIVMILLGFSCMDEKKTKYEDVNTTNKKNNILIIELKVRTKEDDKFEIYFVDDFPENNFSPEKRVSSYVKGGLDYQTVTFTLPKDVLPYNIRFDVGDNNNKYETSIEIKSISFKLNNNFFEIDNSIIDSFLKPNEYLQKTENGYTRKMMDGKYDPFLLAKPILIKKIELEL